MAALAPMSSLPLVVMEQSCALFILFQVFPSWALTLAAWGIWRPLEAKILRARLSLSQQARFVSLSGVCSQLQKMVRLHHLR
jgi:hypothetical protein